MKAMRVAALYLAVGLAGGFALSALMSDDPQIARTPFESAADPALERRVAELEARLAAVSAQTDALSDEINQLDIMPVGAESSGGTGRQSIALEVERMANFDPENMPENIRERVAEIRGMGGRNASVAERLTSGGFSEIEAQRIETRVEELRVAELESRYAAMRSDDPQSAQAQRIDGDDVLRAELGDADYARYREAMGQSTRVDVSSVLASSAAQVAGIQPGDQILSYGGQRVFDTRELNSLVLEGEPGEPVILDIERDGQPIQLVIPRGPLGISSGRRGR